MYNGIGLTTPRGTGTSGYVQANLSNLHFSKNRTDYNTEAEIAKAEAEVNREPNAELLDHEFKRAIEIKCVEFEDLMEGKGFSEEEIRSKVDEYRQLLYTDLESGRQGMLDKGELDLRNSHSRAKVAKDARDRFRLAVGIDAAFVDGSSLEKIRKATEAAQLASNTTTTTDADTKDKEEMEKSLMEKVMDRLKKAKETKKRKKAESSSSSSSSDSDSDSSSSSTTSSSSSSTDSEERRRRRVKRKEQQHKKKESARRERKESPPKFKVPKQELESVRSGRPPADSSRESTRVGVREREEPRSRTREDGRGGESRRRGSNEEARNDSPPRRQRREERSHSRERRRDSRSHSRERRPDRDEGRDERR